MMPNEWRSELSLSTCSVVWSAIDQIVAQMSAAGQPDLAEDYLELLKSALTHTLYSEVDGGVQYGRNVLARGLLAVLESRNLVPVRVGADAQRKRIEGRDWPVFAQSMIGRARLDHLQWCIEEALRSGVSGDLIETGVWRGGAVIFMRGVLRARGCTDRRVYVADSFRGLPAPDPRRYAADAGATWHLKSRWLRVSLEEVRANFERYRLLDDQVHFLEGWFKDSLPTVSDRRWAVIRLDGDMYESTIDALENLYPQVSAGGFVIIDDFAISSCREAVEDYRERNHIREPLHEVDWSGAWWRRSQ